MNSYPYFTIVIPVFNREQEILRAVNSCLGQSFTDIEVVIVDDGSRDQTAAVVESLTDPRIVLVRHQSNQGVCQARNTGIAHSRGEWILFLDSDDEFLPGALALLQTRTATCPEDIDKLGLLFQRDNGDFTPQPLPTDCELDYWGFIAWNDQLIISDFFQCTRRHTFQQVKFAESRAYEDSYLFDFTLRYKMRLIPLAVAIVHLDSANRISDTITKEPLAKMLREAPDHLAAMEDILARHGEGLRLHGPRYFRVYRKALMMYSFLAGKRGIALRRAGQYLKSYPACWDGWGILLAGLMGSRVLAATKWLKYNLPGKR